MTYLAVKGGYNLKYTNIQGQRNKSVFRAENEQNGNRNYNKRSFTFYHLLSTCDVTDLLTDGWTVDGLGFGFFFAPLTMIFSSVQHSGDFVVE